MSIIRIVQDLVLKRSSTYIESCPVHHISLDGFIHTLHDPVCHSLDTKRSEVLPLPMHNPYLKNDGGWYTVAEKLVKFGTDLHHSFGRLLLHDQITDLMTICLPIWFCDVERPRKIGSEGNIDIAVVPLRIKTHDCILRASKTSNAFLILPAASSAICKEASGGRSNLSFLATCSNTVCICANACYLAKTRDSNEDHLFYGRRGHSDEQTSTLYGRDEPTCAIGAQYDPQVGHVLLHRSTQGGLCIT